MRSQVSIQFFRKFSELKRNASAEDIRFKLNFVPKDEMNEMIMMIHHNVLLQSRRSILLASSTGKHMLAVISNEAEQTRSKSS